MEPLVVLLVALLVPLQLTVVPCLIAIPMVAAGAWQPPASPEHYESDPHAPPLRLGRLQPARPLTARLLHVELSHRSYVHPEIAGRSTDPAVAALDGAALRGWTLDLTYGLPLELGLHCRLSRLRLDPGTGEFAGAASGWSDLEAGIVYAPHRGERLAARAEAGWVLPTGSDAIYSPDGSRMVTPFTAGQRETYASLAARARLSGRRAAVAFDLHAAAVYRPHDSSASGSFLPYRLRLPLLAVSGDGGDRDQLDLQFAFSISRGSAALYTVCELPRLREVTWHEAGEAPRSLTQGVRVAVGSRMIASVEAEIGFASDSPVTSFNPLEAYPEWQFRVGLQTSLAPFDRDRDHDGVGDLVDRCPLAAEDRDGFADEDGCPDPDNDGDGVFDAADICPREAEDLDGHADGDGCPDLDNDQDGIPDDLDDCPDAAEDPDGFEDGDGCPDPDNDQDGVPDDVDACPEVPEDADGVEDADGCPEP